MAVERHSPEHHTSRTPEPHSNFVSGKVSVVMPQQRPSIQKQASIHNSQISYRPPMRKSFTIDDSKMTPRAVKSAGFPAIQRQSSQHADAPSLRRQTSVNQNPAEKQQQTSVTPMQSQEHHALDVELAKSIKIFFRDMKPVQTKLQEVKTLGKVSFSCSL